MRLNPWDERDDRVDDPVQADLDHYRAVLARPPIIGDDDFPPETPTSGSAA